MWVVTKKETVAGFRGKAGKALDLESGGKELSLWNFSFL
jgi:hypothetical protein